MQPDAASFALVAEGMHISEPNAVQPARHSAEGAYTRQTPEYAMGSSIFRDSRPTAKWIVIRLFSLSASKE